MAKFKIVVEDADKTNEFELNRYTDAFLRSGAKKFLADKLAKEKAPIREKGFIHTEVDSECPEGLPNCRNCGDPNYKQSCKEAGHCSDCGTRHGIAPDSVLAKNGFKLEQV